jgi:hypothetical protein
MVDRGGADYDFSFIAPFIDAMRRHKIMPIWDLCHYGYPDGADPFAPDFADRFARYAGAVAEACERRPARPLFLHAHERDHLLRLHGRRMGLGRAVRQGQGEAARADPRHVPRRHRGRRGDPGGDPGRAHGPYRPADQRRRAGRPSRPGGAARVESCDDAFLAFDIISGQRHPELGGSPETLDIAGFNNYSFGQMEYREGGPHAALDAGDPRIRPLCDLIEQGYRRYRRPVIVAETSGMEGGRDDWLNDVVGESLAAVNRGVELHGICMFPAVDMPDWHTGEWLNNGIADLVLQPGGDLKRVPFRPYVEALHSWQRRLNRPEALDADPFDTAVDLNDVVRAARDLRPKADADWH